MTELDALAPALDGLWKHENVTVRHLDRGDFEFARVGDSVSVTHSSTSADIGERLVSVVTAQAHHIDLNQREFELVMVGLVRSTVADPIEAWTTYYRNSLDDLLADNAEFAPVHQRAESLVSGSVLDLGSCFGFFPLRLALSGHDVTATDLSAGTMRLLGTVAPHLGVTLETLTCDAARVPVADNSVDTVTAIHLLEHVDAAVGARIISEALRIARRRVVIAVPFENQATSCHGHVRTFDISTLTALGDSTGMRFEVTEHHGGWLILDTASVPQPV